jgi:diguanylate cyclase (GGDEF)-like protein
MALLRAFLVLLVLALASITVVVLFSVSRVKSTTAKAQDTSATALLAAESEAELAKLLGLLQHKVDEYVRSPEFLALPEESRSVILAELARTDLGAPAQGTNSPPVRLTPSETLIVVQTVNGLMSAYESFRGTTGDDASRQQVEELSATGTVALTQFFANPSPGNTRRLLVNLEAALDLTDERAIVLGIEARDDLAHVQDVSNLARLAILLTVLGVGIAVLLFVRYMAQRIRKNIEDLSHERNALASTTGRLQYRNDQLNALYNVFAEITSTLSLRYVVNATMRESMQIMSADLAVLRILRGSELIVEGAMTSDGQMLEGLPPVPLGEGPTGRAAKRGRTLRIDKDAEQLMGTMVQRSPGSSPAEQSNRSPMQSGLIVPMVVGARVVGTLACWALAEDKFSDEDERIMEMMASTAATAIVAADTTDASVRRAHHDALTGLPNRRQLDEDKADTLARLVESGRSAVVAMVDIDHFKRFNDEFGHRVGDVTLQKVASVLRSAVREDDHVYRYGGEEFLVVFTDTPPSEAILVANRLRTAVEAAPLSGENLEPVGPVTISIGLAFVPAHSTDIEVLIGLADKAMYKAKERGRNRVEIWEEETLQASVA